jgi:hypothetical protein
VRLRPTRARASLRLVNKRGSLRASDADRDQIVDRLHKASTEGRIASEEFEQRVSLALKARTYSELEETVADLPGPGGRRQPARRSAGRWAVGAVRTHPLLLLFAIPAVAVTAALVLAATIAWAVVMMALMVAGGRHRRFESPWMYTRNRRPYSPPRRGQRSYWA